MDCENCIYGDIAEWKQDTKTGQAKATWWCEWYRCFCEDIQICFKEDICKIL